MDQNREQLLDELALCYVRVAVDEALKMRAPDANPTHAVEDEQTRTNNGNLSIPDAHSQLRSLRQPDTGQ